jgi:hypothetical protein
MERFFNLEKPIWDENDFEQMGWHDSKIYAIAFKDESFELLLDIDYIVKWVAPNEKESYFKFWVAPATIVFRNVWDLNIGLEYDLNLEIQDLQRGDVKKPQNTNVTSGSLEYDWKIEVNNGEITFKSIGYKQYFRKDPILLNTQKIDLLERGGISFGLIS